MSTVFLFQQKFCVMIFLTEITKEMEPIMVGILYCQKSKLAYDKIETMLLKNGIPARLIAIEKADRHSLEPFSVLINAMDRFYPDDKLDLLVDLFREGKNFIHLCAAPFTINLRNGRTNLRALRSFGIVDGMRMAV